MVAIAAGAVAIPSDGVFPDAAREGPVAASADAERRHSSGRQQSVPSSPGEQWWTIQEGEITYTVKGQPPRVLKVGDWVYVPRGTIHRNQNLTNAPARAVEMNITDKDVPQTEVVPE